MGSIDITTAQNVIIEYETAELKDRIFAFIIDNIIIWVSIGVLNLILALALQDAYSQNISIVIWVAIFFFYTPISEIIMNGQTIGKKALKIRVVNLGGRAPFITDYLIRWVFRMVDIWFSWGVIASMLINSTNSAQRLGGMLSNTTVVKENPKLNYKLKDILNIIDKSSYTVQYPDVKRFSEEEVLFLKKTIERSKKYPNQAHKDAVNKLVNKICQQFELTKKPEDNIAFLRTLLRDYIVLTR